MPHPSRIVGRGPGGALSRRQREELTNLRMEINSDVIAVNYSYIQVNNANIGTNHGTIQVNNGTVDTNYGEISISTGTVVHNYGIVSVRCSPNINIEVHMDNFSMEIVSGIQNMR
jgi:hypothetical protein